MQVGGYDVMDQNCLENLFLRGGPSFVPEDSSFKGPSEHSPDMFSWSLDELEQLLMEDDRDEATDMGYSPPLDDFLSEVLLDSPIDNNGPGEVVDFASSGNLMPLEEKNDDQLDKGKNDNSNNGDAGAGDNDDPASKKRKRQMRNRDAAVRSRERKKTYVRDLELKSKYFEGECKRLGMLLNCYLADNQALRNTILNNNIINSQKVFVDDSSVTKHESAVLLLESLLLGSLLWFPGIIILCLLLQLGLPLALDAALLETVGDKRQVGLKAAMPGKAFRSFMMGKRCKGSRSRMKPLYPLLKSSMFVFFVFS